MKFLHEIFEFLRTFSSPFPAVLKAIESNNEKSYIYFFERRLNIQKKDNCDRQSAEKKLFKFVFYMVVRKTKLLGVGFVPLDSGREPNGNLS